MKKITVFVLCLCLMVGCNSQPSNSNSNTNESNSNLISNSNSNTNSNVTKNEVHLYLFHSATCSHCQEEISWLNSIDGEYPYLKIHTYEASENSELYEKVKKAMEIESVYVPLTIIGNDYYIGYDAAKGRKFLRTINEYSESGFCDVVGTIINDGDVKACMDKNKGE